MGMANDHNPLDSPHVTEVCPSSCVNIFPYVVFLRLVVQLP